MLEKDKSKAPIGSLLVVESLDRATDYYYGAFGAIETERYAAPDGKVWYAVIHIQGTPVQLMEPVPEMGMVAAGPNDDGDSLVHTVAVGDTNATFRRAVEAGARTVLEPHTAAWDEQHAEFRDPFGHRWALGSRLLKHDQAKLPVAPSLVVENLDETAEWYRAVLGASAPVRFAGPKPDRPFGVVRINDAPLQFMAASKEHGLVAHGKNGRPGGDISSLALTVNDVDKVFQTAMDRGATAIIEPQVAYWGDRYAEFRDLNGVRVAAGCGDANIASQVVDPADAQAAFRNFLRENQYPSSPAGAVGVKNINV
jgi:PhnB protein